MGGHRAFAPWLVAAVAEWPDRLYPAPLEDWPKMINQSLLPCWSNSVLEDVEAGWPALCCDLTSAPATASVACRKACTMDPACQTWVFTETSNCFIGAGTKCLEGGPGAHDGIVAGQRIQHGHVAVLKDTAGWQAMNLYHLGSFGAASQAPEQTLGSPGRNGDCPAGYENMTSELECRSAADTLGYEFAALQNNDAMPAGCYRFDEVQVYFNYHPTGSSHASAASICSKAECSWGTVGGLARVVSSGVVYSNYDEMVARFHLKNWQRFLKPEEGSSVSVLGCKKDQGDDNYVVAVEDSNHMQYIMQSSGLEDLSILRCKMVCYSDLYCRYWSYGEGGCWVEAPNRTSDGTGVEYPMQVGYGIKRNTSRAKTFVAGQFIRHYCPPVPPGATPVDTPTIQTEASGTSNARLRQALIAAGCAALSVILLACLCWACRRKNRKLTARGLTPEGKVEQPGPPPPPPEYHFPTEPAKPFSFEPAPSAPPPIEVPQMMAPNLFSSLGAMAHPHAAYANVAMYQPPLQPLHHTYQPVTQYSDRSMPHSPVVATQCASGWAY